MRSTIHLVLATYLVGCGVTQTSTHSSSIPAQPECPELPATTPTMPEGHAGMLGGKALKSSSDVPTTVANLEAAIKEKGLTHFATIDHAANAKGAGLELLPTTVVIFGNPNVGTQLMAANQTIAVNLPLKIAVYQDTHGTVWVVYEEPAVLLRRHGITDMAPLVAKMSAVLASLTQTAPSQRASE